ncbi:MAG: porin family protein [Bacteroidota bacterium]
MKLIVLTVLLCCSCCADAQINWAITAGGQSATASYTSEGTKIATHSIAGFNAGVLARIYFDNKVAFVTGLQFNARGFAIKTIPDDTQKTYHLNYVVIPLLLQFDLSKKAGAGLYGKLGPSVGIGINGRELYTGANGNQVRNKAVLSMTGNHFGLFDASLNAAFGYSIKQHFFVEAAYAYGIGNVNNDPAGPNIKSRVLSLSAGYFFR